MPRLRLGAIASTYGVRSKSSNKIFSPLAMLVFFSQTLAALTAYRENSAV